MNRALLRHLQAHTSYPSVTLLHSTRPGRTMHPDDMWELFRLVDSAQRRLTGHVSVATRDAIGLQLDDLIAASVAEPTSAAIAICVSPETSAVVRLSTPVRTRCVVGDTFATRDMVADLNRTAVFRLVTVSESMVQLFVGDRHRVAEDHDERWPLLRAEGQTLAQWTRAVSHAARRELEAFPLPTVVAGVERTVRQVLKIDRFEPVGVITGNHDRSSWATLHALSWPLVEQWLQADRDKALTELEQARSARRYAGGLDEVWDLAHEGRVQLLVVEEAFEVSAHITDGRLTAADAAPADVSMAGDLTDDAVDELIELVLRQGGETIIVPDGDLEGHDRLAAVLRS